MLPFIAAITQKSFLTLVDKFFTRDTPIRHFPWKFVGSSNERMSRKFPRGFFIAGPLHQKRSKFWSFHWPMLLLFDLFVTAFLFNTIENKKDKIIPTLRATLISCYCQELTSINNRTENNSYQTTLPRMSIFWLWILIFASKPSKTFCSQNDGNSDHFVS